MIRHMRHGSPPRLRALQSILSPNRRESLPTPSAGVRMTAAYREPGHSVQHRAADLDLGLWAGRVPARRQWERHEPFLSPQWPRTGRPSHDHRPIITGILWVRAGVTFTAPVCWLGRFEA